VVREVALEDALEDPEVASAGGVASGGGAVRSVGSELEEFGLSLSEALCAEAERVVALGDGEDAANHIPGGVGFFRPEMEGAAVVVRGESVFGGSEIEEDAAVFEEGRIGVGFEESRNGGGDFRRGLGYVRGRGSGRGHVGYGSKCFWRLPPISG